jgi:hypothetical protein
VGDAKVRRGVKASLGERDDVVEREGFDGRVGLAEPAHAVLLLVERHPIDERPALRSVLAESPPLPVRRRVAHAGADASRAVSAAHAGHSRGGFSSSCSHANGSLHEEHVATQRQRAPFRRP